MSLVFLEEMVEMDSRALLVQVASQGHLVHRDNRDHRELRDQLAEMEGKEQMAHQVQTAFRGHMGIQALLGQMEQMEY